MSFNKGYTSRNNPRYNQGQFVSAGIAQPAGNTPMRATRSTAAASVTNITPTTQINTDMYPSAADNSVWPTQGGESWDNNKSETMEATENNVVLTGNVATTNIGNEVKERPSWMKPNGIKKKIPMKERRKRRNKQLQKLLTPKNALMVLNEMFPGEQLPNMCNVEQLNANTMDQDGLYHNMDIRNNKMLNFAAAINFGGQHYKGFGSSKMNARNAAAEHMIRDQIIKKMNNAMNKELQSDAGSTTSGGDDEEIEALPMLQLASFALYKLFEEWTAEGYQVPFLNKSNPAVNTNDQLEQKPENPVKSRGKPKTTLPPEAEKMHPCMLLTYMRPGVEYTELGSEGTTPQTLIFTIGVSIDGTTFIGKAPSKKEARRNAAKSAIQQLYNIKYE